MPRICEFYGIVIYMYRPDHPPAHFHARYGEYEARSHSMARPALEGELPPRAFRLVQEWARLHQAELVENWDRLSDLRLWSPSIRCPSISLMLGITNATPLDNHVLRMEFTDGSAGDVDCSFLLESGLGVELRDPSYFRQARSTLSCARSCGRTVWTRLPSSCTAGSAPRCLQRRSSLAAKPPFKRSERWDVLGRFGT